MPPNLLLMMTDHQRADSLGMVQAGLEVTPNLSRLTGRSARFTRAYNTCPLCVPARTALATGLYPTRNGVVTNDWPGETAGDWRPLHQDLAEAGYAVAHVGVDHVRLQPTLRERVDFALWCSNEQYRQYAADRGLAGGDASDYRSDILDNYGGHRERAAYSNTRTGPWPGEAEDFLDSFYARQAEAFLRNPPADRPWALMVQLWAPHPPLRVPEPYASLFDPAALDLPANVGRVAEGEPSSWRDGVAAQLGTDVPLEQWRRVWAAHLGLVRLADDCLGRLLEALDATGQAERTVVAFTADHGDHLGQHAMYQKMEMYEPAIRVPLLLSGPGIRTAEHATCVSHLDLVPTLGELLGLPAREGLDGLSLAPVLRGQAPLPDRPVFSQYSGNRYRGDIRRCVVRGRHKYVYGGHGQVELFDLDADPLEMTNLAADPAAAELCRELHGLCAVWHRARGDWIDYDTDGSGDA